MSQPQSIEMRRESVRSLILYLGEKEEELFKDCLWYNAEILKIFVYHEALREDPVDASILLEGREMLQGCGSTAKACALLIGLIYAFNIAYPQTLRYTFEVFQKIFLELDGLSCPQK